MPRINEFHYDNASTDAGEFLEIRIPAGEELSDYNWYLYNGSNGTVYEQGQVGAGLAVDSGDGYAYIVVFTNESNFIQNGAPDGIALTGPGGTVIEFLSYEGTFDATDGPASGMTSTDILVEQGGATPTGSSLQRTGDNATDWIVTDGSNTEGMVNVCFMNGTHLLTTEGEKKVEDLKVGDRMITADGREKPIRWIGQQLVPFGQHPKRGYPICISKDALGVGFPHRDLFVSPGHGIVIEGLLINAGALVNGYDIDEHVPTGDFDYYHIELDSHDVVIAEGLPSESYLPCSEYGDVFDNRHDQESRERNILFPMAIPRIMAAYRIPAHLRERLGIRLETRVSA